MPTSTPDALPRESWATRLMYHHNAARVLKQQLLIESIRRHVLALNDLVHHVLASSVDLDEDWTTVDSQLLSQLQPLLRSLIQEARINE